MSIASSRRRVVSESQLSAAFDPERILRVLAQHRVEFVLVGALGAKLFGFPRMTSDADITPAMDAENLDRVVAALRELGARVYTDSVPEGLAFDFSARSLARASLWNLVTDAGRLDLVFSPKGVGGFEELAARSVEFEVFGHSLRVAKLEDILLMKEAADRPQDRQDALVIREMLARDSG
jgi:hypothetical protein